MKSRTASFLFTMALAPLIAGCFTGERPHFDHDPFRAGTATGDPAIDAVLTRLDAVITGPATALYAVLTKFGNTTSSATVTLDGSRRAIEIGNVQFVENDSEQFTCTLDGSAPCASGINEARVSDVGITFDFYAADAARRLRRDAQAKVGPATASEEVIANQQATCVTVPVTGGSAIYCALANGMIAKLDDGDVLIVLGLLTPTVDPARLEPISP
ncbi:MAG: hypothetical protein HY826_11695 [Actinobacteria bacterium]|nr:hypothetical protein [Actinomycetota bacterium]